VREHEIKIKEKLKKRKKNEKIGNKEEYSRVGTSKMHGFALL